MQQHQKYFPLLDRRTGRLLNRFLIVSNLRTDDPRSIIAGNERVLRARLADAKFFFDQDRKVRARRARGAARVRWCITTSSAPSSSGCSGSASSRARSPGSCAADVRQGRARRLAVQGRSAHATWSASSPSCRASWANTTRATTARTPTVARAIEAHYHPRFASDTLPEDNVSAAVALADKLDTLVGIYGIGLVPTGDKDPFGLRRQALGVLRILAERALPLDLMELLQLAKLSFAPDVLRDSVAADLHAFMLERLRSYLRERGFALDEIDSVVGQNPTRIDLVVPRLKAVQAFRATARSRVARQRQQAHPQYPEEDRGRRDAARSGAAP